MLTLLLVSIATLAFNIQPAKAFETIYIQADGSVFPSTAPIQQDGDVYTFTDNIYDSIWVMRDNIVIDGAGYMLQGTTSIIQGIRLYGRTNVTVQNMQIKDFQNGIVLDGYSNNTSISKNSITNTNNGIWLKYSSSSNISGNNIANNSYNIRLEYSSRNNISGNTITNYRGIYLYNSSNNSIGGNAIATIYYGIWLYYYASFNSISGNNITANNDAGIVLSDSSNNNRINGNNIANNGQGISLISSSNNKIYHNNFMGNPQQVYSLSSINTWDDGYPSGGNYWSDYTGIDSNCDGIGDSLYEIASGNIDHYPLIGMFAEFKVASEYHVQTICNSTISDFQFDGTAIRFNVSGENGTSGFCRICIPTALMNGTYRVFVNGTEVSCNFLSCSNSTYSYLYFNYVHSTQEVIIIPEFPSFLILSLFIMTALLVAILCRRKQKPFQKIL